MDENFREDRLFNCLRIPNDDVKLAVVECLFYVPLCQLNAEEQRNLLVEIERTKNIGTGRTEFVLAMIFNIISNLVSDVAPESE